VNNDSMSHDFTHVLSLVQEQMRDLSVMQQKRAMLTATGTAADGAVEVTVDAQRTVTKTAIDESYLDEFELADLSAHITAAAQEAAQEIERQSAALLVPLTERRQEISSFSDLIVDAPDFQGLISNLHSSGAPAADSRGVDAGDDGAEDLSNYPTVRR
jgi:DNA-binding protein YbaB